MKSIDEVILALRICVDDIEDMRCQDCPYYKDTQKGCSYTHSMDAIAYLEELKERRKHEIS